MRIISLLIPLVLCTAVSADDISLGEYSHAARQELEGRVRKVLAESVEESSVAGTVTYSGHDAFFIQGQEEALKIVVERGALPKSGDAVEAKGRPALEGGRVVFAAKSWKKTGEKPLPPPRKARAADLLFAGGDGKQRKTDVNWILVEVRGRAVALTESGFAIEVDGLPVTVAVDPVPAYLGDCDRTRPIVSVKGVAELILDQSVLFSRSRQVMGVKINANGLEAVELIPDAVYLVNRRDRRVMLLVGGVILLLVCGLLALVWFSVRQARRQLRTKTLMDERKRMADDLHDTIEQHLVGAGMLLQLNRNKEAGEILVRAKREMRDIIWGLKNDDMMRLTPSAMIKELAHSETKKGLYRVTARLEGLPEHLDAQEMRDLSLIVREAIGNAVKHGGAKKIAISADPREKGGWLLRIANDGAPFDEKSAPGVKEGHFGLEGMRQRARRLCADVSIFAKGEWTVVAVEKKTLCCVLLAALTWFPAPDWREKPDPVASPHAVKGGTIRFNGAQPPKSFNAYIDNNNYSAMVFDLMYEKLLETDGESADLAPSLARRWAVSENGREFTFVLDERAKWSDGSPVTAEDVKWTFDLVMSPKSDTGPWKSMLGFFESPEIVDARTVRFRKTGDSPKDWRDILNCSTFWILPKRFFGSRELAKFDFLNAVVGGPYGISRVEEQVETELRRHGRWWRQDLPQCRGRANFDRILMRYYVDNENAFEALKSRKIDAYPVYAARVFAEGTRGAKFQRNWMLKRRVKNHAPVGFQGFAMNMRRKPFDNLKVRQAMAKLVDRETMNSTMMNGAYFLLNSYFHDLYDAAHPCTNTLWKFDVDGAKRLLAEAGYGKGFSFAFLSRSATEDKFLTLFAQALRDCSVKMEIVRKDFASWMRDMDAFNFDMTWASWGAGIVKNPELMWLGKEADRKGSNNIAGFRSDEVDRIIEAEKGYTDGKMRINAYKRIDALIAAQVPYVLLWHTDEVRLVYWNKFGMPKTVLSRFAHEEDILSYWWYDADRVDELERAIKGESFLPTVPEVVFFDEAMAK